MSKLVLFYLIEFRKNTTLKAIAPFAAARHKLLARSIMSLKSLKLLAIAFAAKVATIIPCKKGIILQNLNAV